MSTTTQNVIRKIIEESEVQTEAAHLEEPLKLSKKTVVIQTPVRTPVKSGKIHKVAAKKDQPVCVDFSALDSETYDVVMWDSRLGGSILKRMTFDRPKHLPVDFSLKFYTQSYADVQHRFEIGLVPINKDGDVMMGKDKVGTTEEKVPDFPRESGVILSVISDFSVAKACETDLVKPSFNYAFFRTMDKKLTLFASDSRRLSYTTSGFTAGDSDLVSKKIDGAFIPRTALEAKSDITLLYASNHYLVSYDNVTLRYREDGIQVLGDGILKEVTNIEKGAAFEMGLAMQHIKIKAKDKSVSHKVTVFLDSKGAHLNLVNPDVENVARVPVIGTGAVSFGINAAYLLEGITFTGDTVLYQNKERPEASQMFIKSDKGDRVSVIMPMLIRQSDEEADITAEEA